jgi:hypothetical protein
MISYVFEDAQVEEVVLALDGGGLSVLLLVVDLALQQIVRLLFVLAEDVGLYSLGLLLTPLCTVHVALPRLLLSSHGQKALYFHVWQDLVGGKSVSNC